PSPVQRAHPPARPVPTRRSSDLEDADVAQSLTEILREDGLDVLTDAQALRVARAAGGAVEQTVRTPDGERTLTGSHLLIGAGRTGRKVTRLNSSHGSISSAVFCL